MTARNEIAQHAAHRAKSYARHEFLREIGHFDGRPPLHAPLEAARPHVLLTLVPEGRPEDSLADRPIDGLVNEAIWEAGLAAFLLRKTFVPEDNAFHLLLSHGSRLDQVERRALRAIRLLHGDAGHMDRDVVGRPSRLQPISPVSASLTVGDTASIADRRSDGLLYRWATAVCGAGKYPTWRMDHRSYGAIHQNGATARSELSVFHRVRAEGVWCYQARSGPDRLAPARAAIRG